MPSQTREPQVTPTAAGIQTGVPAVDEVIAIVAAGDGDALAARAHPQEVLCASLPGNMCAELGSEPEEMVSVLPGAICDSNPFPASELDIFASTFLDRVHDADVHAAWDAQGTIDGPTHSVPTGSVRVLWGSGSSLVISEDGEIWLVLLGCGPVNEVTDNLPENTEYRIEPPIGD